MVDELPEPQPVPPVEDGSYSNPSEVSQARAALVAKRLKMVQDAEGCHSDAFKEMKENQDFAAKGADAKWVKSKKYRVPILSRHINQAVSTLYARNPTVLFKRKKRLLYKLWDGRSDTLQFALEQATMGDPASIELLSEVVAARRYEKMLDRMGETLQILWEYFLNEQSANYKQQIKALVRRVKVCKVGYIKLGYQRIMEADPDVDAKIDDVTSKIKEIECLVDKVSQGNVGENDADMEDLRLQLEDLQGQREIVVREGPVLSFPKANAVIIDDRCHHLKSLSGAHWIAFPYDMTDDEIYQTYETHITKAESAPVHYSDGQGKTHSDRKGKSRKKDTHRVYEVWDKDSQMVYTICEGHHDFLKEPQTPDVHLERFWPLFPVVFNEVEHDEMLYPPSDVEQARDIQNEYNRSREALRQHRIAARPFYIEAGRLSEEDKSRLADHDDHEVITLASLAANEKVENLVQRGPTAPIDPNLYEVEIHFQDLLRVVGTQEANLGGVSGGTATESSIAEASRNKSDQDNVDDVDEVLTELSRAAAQLMLMNMDKESVIEIVGEGAVWPDTPVTREAAAKEITLEVEAGSSGRPNQASDLANLERATPLLLQIPGIQPTPLGRRMAELINLDPDELVVDGNPSITAINAVLTKAAQGMGAAQPGDSDPASDPNMQGGNGADNAPSPMQPAPGAQPAYPAADVGLT